MGFSKWMKQAHELAAEHSDKVHAGIDKAATAAKSAVQPKH